MSNETDLIETPETDVETPVETTSGLLSRRGFFLSAGAAAAAVTLAACGSDDDDDTATGGDTDDDADGDGGGGASGDVATAEFAASLEVLAVGTYKAGLDAATAGDLGEVPPAVAEFATTAMGHHQEHLDAWNGIITGAGGDEVTEPPADLKSTVDGKFGQVKDVAGLAQLALELEMIAADTYLSALPNLQGSDARKLAASIQAVDRQHQAILLYALGQYPVPQVFQNTDMAATPS